MVHIVLAVVNNLITAHYNIIMKTTVASSGMLPSSSLVGHQMAPLAQVWCGHHDEVAPLVQWFGWSSS